MQEQGLSLHTRLNLETAPIRWLELGRFFAKGQVIQVDPQLDLVAVAVAFAQDNVNACQQWLQKGQVVRLSDEVAKLWAQEDSHLWAVVVAPWVLVQNRSSQ